MNNYIQKLLRLLLQFRAIVISIVMLIVVFDDLIQQINLLISII